MKTSSTMPLRTRIFSAILKRISIPMDEVDATGLPELRARRQRLQASRMGRFVFGTPLDGVAIEDRVGARRDRGDPDRRLQAIVTVTLSR